MLRNAILAAAITLTVGAATTTAQAASWPGCAAFATQPQAQAAWVAAGSPPAGDGDSDGIACESLPAGPAPFVPEQASQPVPQLAPAPASGTSNCRRSSRIVNVTYSARRYPRITAHARAAIILGYPAVLRVNRKGADKRRTTLLSVWPARRGYDRDEYPPAVGPSKVDADVRYIRSRENRSAGAVLGNTLAGFCDGQRFRYRIVR